MKHPKYPRDFKDWRPLRKVTGDKYLIIESPDGVLEACIHIRDNDVVGIKHKATGIDIYDGNQEMAKKLGIKI